MTNLEYLYAAGTSGQHWGIAVNCHCSLKAFVNDGGTWRGGNYAEAAAAWRAVGNPASDVVTAPPGGVKEWDKWPLGGPLCQDRVRGAWAVIQIRFNLWRLEFCGTHQNVPQLPTARTPGRALWRGRRALRRLAIPAVH